MNADGNIAESHGLLQFVYGEAIATSDLGNDNAITVSDNEYDLFETKVEKKQAPLSEINYTPKYENDKWYDRSSVLEFEQWMRSKNGATEIKFLTERYYLEKDYTNAFELSTEYIQSLKKSGKINVKGLITREMLEIVALCCNKLGKHTEAAEYVRLHQRLNNRDPGHLYFRGNIYRDAGLFLDSMLEYKSYLSDRKQDPQVWNFMGVDVLAISQELRFFHSCDTQDILKIPIKEKTHLDLKIFQSLLCYLSVLLALGCQLKALSILQDCGTWPELEFAQRRKHKQINQVIDDILACSKCLGDLEKDGNVELEASCVYLKAMLKVKNAEICQRLLEVLDSSTFKLNTEDFTLIENEISLVINATFEIIGISQTDVKPDTSILSVYSWIPKNLFLTRGKALEQDALESTVEDL